MLGVFVNGVVLVLFFDLAHFKSVVFVDVSEFYALLNLFVENVFDFYPFFVVLVRAENRRGFVEQNFVGSVNEFSASLYADSRQNFFEIARRGKFKRLFFGGFFFRIRFRFFFLFFGSLFLFFGSLFRFLGLFDFLDFFGFLLMVGTHRF